MLAVRPIIITMEYYCNNELWDSRTGRGSSSTFKPFGVVSNESLRVGAVAARNHHSLRGGSSSRDTASRHSNFASRSDASAGASAGGAGDSDWEKQLQHRRIGGRGVSGGSNNRGVQNRGNRGNGSCVVLFATPQELGDRCVKFIKEQRSRVHMICRCAMVLACWQKYR